MIEISRVIGDEYLCLCPFHDDTAPSLSVNLSKDVAHCYAGCYDGDIIGLIARVFEVNRWEARLISVDDLFSGGAVGKTDDLLSVNVWKKATQNKYLLGRGFLSETIETWGIESNSIAEAIRIPYCDIDDTCLGYIHRFTNSKKKPKYKNSYKFIKKVLFGINHYEGPIPIIVEGPLDAIWLWQYGVKCGLALLGAGITQQQLEELKKISSEVILCFDNDNVGRDGARETGLLLNKNGIESVVLKLPEEVKDFQEMSEMQLDELFKGGII